MSDRIDVRNGAVYLDAGTVERYFKGIEAVILLIRDGELQILPVHQMAAGGCLLKQHNAAGDRVASAPDVFRANELENWSAKALEATWSNEKGALVATLEIAN
jgi:hypothetical protein